MSNCIEQTPAWANAIAAEAGQATCLTIGFASGSRANIDPRATDRLMGYVEEALAGIDAHCRTLLLRLDVFPSRKLGRGTDQPDSIPVAHRSPLGHWSQVTVPVPVGMRASWSLERIPEWLPVWKSEFGLILIDLGPVHLVPSRIAGRLCDANYLLLGPDSSGSPEWLMQHIARHEQCGSTIRGSLVSSFRTVAA